MHSTLFEDRSRHNENVHPDNHVREQYVLILVAASLRYSGGFPGSLSLLPGIGYVALFIP